MSDADAERVEPLMREAARVPHPTRSAHNALMTRVAALERRVAYLSQKLDLVVAALDAEGDAALMDVAGNGEDHDG